MDAKGWVRSFHLPRIPFTIAMILHRKQRPVTTIPARAPRAVPGLEFLREVEERFSVALPQVFLDFCHQYSETDVAVPFPRLRRGAFLVDFSTFEAINRQIGGEEWNDYERILTGKTRPKSGLRLWGGLVPFYYDEPKNKRRRGAALAETIYGFPSDKPGSAEVRVWSVHTIVHVYASFDAWLDEQRR
jgi:hypothetical protein